MPRAWQIALLVALIAAGFGAWQTFQLRSVRAALAQSQARVVGYEEADRWRSREYARQAAVTALDVELQSEEGADAPLSDYLRRSAGRVWP